MKNGLQTKVDEIAPDIFRISTWVPDISEHGFTFNQFLLTGEEPFLFHCGQRGLFPLVSAAIDRVIRLGRLRWISFAHVEADECVAVNHLLAAAPHAEPLLISIEGQGALAVTRPQSRLFGPGGLGALALHVPLAPALLLDDEVKKIFYTALGIGIGLVNRIHVFEIIERAIKPQVLDALTAGSSAYVRQLHADQVRGLVARRIKRPVQLLITDHQTVDGVEGAQNVFARPQAQSPQENRPQEFALPIDTHIEHVLLVVLEFNPRSTVGNDLTEEVGAIVRGLKEDAGRAMQLADDYARRPVHNERAVLSH